MTSYEYLLAHSHSLGSVARMTGTEPEDLLRHLGVASGAEKVLIRAAISLLPDWDVPEAGEALHFELHDVHRLDIDNTRALLGAIALQAEHPELMR